MSISVCSFCDKHRSEVKLLIEAAPPEVPTRVAICNECITLCLDIVFEETQRK